MYARDLISKIIPVNDMELDFTHINPKDVGLTSLTNSCADSLFTYTDSVLTHTDSRMTYIQTHRTMDSIT